MFVKNSFKAALAVAAVAAVVLAAPTAASATGIVVGSADAGNCYPFSCFASQPPSDPPGLWGAGTTYQQVYAASAFSGAISISSVSFFQDVPGPMDSASYRISFSTTAAGVSGLDTTWANNIGGDAAEFGTYSLSGAMPPVLTFVGTPFVYDPGAGNLLMQVDVLGLTEPHVYESFFWADYTGVVTSRLYAYEGSATGTTALGALRTEFNGDIVSPVPDGGSSVALLGLAMVAVAGARRKFGL
jgi:hypothetical protein